MHRPCWERALTAVLALWFAVVTVEPGALHSCPMHGTLVISAGATAAAVHGHAHVGHGAASKDAPTRGHAHQCSCLGDCGAAGSRLALLATAAALELSAAELITRQAAAGEPRRIATAAAYFLPFANGPPRSRVA
jgi:hypothetical protein